MVGQDINLSLFYLLDADAPSPTFIRQFKGFLSLLKLIFGQVGGHFVQTECRDMIYY